MKLTEIAIATMTLVRDEEEDRLLRESLSILAGYEIPVYITDGGSPASFLDFLKGFPSFTVAGAPAKGLFAQIRNSLTGALPGPRPFILYTEPDKKFFFHELPAFLEEVTANEKTGIFLASRSKAGMASYAAFQQMTETCINKCCTEVTGHFLDYTYGPFILNKKLVPWLEQVQEDIGWGWRPFVFGVAHRLGLTLGEHRGDYLCPPEQQEDSAAERLYRMRQLEQSVRGIVLSASVGLDEQV